MVHVICVVVTSCVMMTLFHKGIFKVFFCDFVFVPFFNVLFICIFIFNFVFFGCVYLLVCTYFFLNVFLYLYVCVF